VACCTSNCTSTDSCFSFTTMFSSLASFYIVSASIKCYFSSLSSSDSLMHTGSTNVAPRLIYFLACQCHLFLRKNSTTDVSVVLF
jgi:hypothetical protein